MPINVVHQPNLGTLGRAYQKAAQQITTQHLRSGTPVQGGSGGGGIIGNPNPLATSGAARDAQSLIEWQTRNAMANQTLLLQQLGRSGGGVSNQLSSPSPSNWKPAIVENDNVRNTSPYFTALDSLFGKL